MVLMRTMVLLVLMLLPAACTGTGESEDSYTVVEASYRVHLEVEPEPLVAGQEARFIVTVEDAESGQPVEGATIRPVADVNMPGATRMSIPLQEVDEIEPGRFEMQTVVEHSGTLKLSVSIVHNDAVTAIAFGEIPVESP